MTTSPFSCNTRRLQVLSRSKLYGEVCNLFGCGTERGDVGEKLGVLGFRGAGVEVMGNNCAKEDVEPPLLPSRSLKMSPLLVIEKMGFIYLDGEIWGASCTR